MAVVVLRVGLSCTALVVVVMVVTVCISEVPDTAVIVVSNSGVVVSILGVACHWSRDRGSVAVLN